MAITRTLRLPRWDSRSPATQKPSLLSPDLVITATARPREPALPDSTVDAALTSPLAFRRARYDVLLATLDADSSGRRRRRALATAWTRRGHRVFWLGLDQPPPTPRGSSPDQGIVIPVPVAPNASPDARSALLRQCRRDHGIETAVMVASAPAWRAAAAEAAAHWGWRHLPSASVASGQWTETEAAVTIGFPRASVVIVTYDNRAFNRLCLASVLENTGYPNVEIIVVDNGSTDGTRDDLAALAAAHPHIRVIANDTNRGFGPANNQALAAASGEILVLLNNDTMVPPGWLTRLARHLDAPTLGLLGPATNRTCNEAQIEAPYETYGAFLRFAHERAITHDGVRHPIRMPMMFCAAMRRDVYERIGPLDEQYEVGMFEDEDYALRIKDAGYDLAWAPDVYVHHAYHATIGKLVPSGDYLRLFHANQRRFEAKWGICWERHRPPA